MQSQSITDDLAKATIVCSAELLGGQNNGLCGLQGIQ